MTWLVILVVLAAAFAPVAYMMPTKRDRALTELRMLARREGLEVDVTHLPRLDAPAHERVSASGKAREPRIDCVSYGRRLDKPQITPVRYRLLRLAGTEFPIPIADGEGLAWELDRKFNAATPTSSQVTLGGDYWQILTELEPLLPSDVLGLAVTDDFVLLYWRERLAPVGHSESDPDPDADTNKPGSDRRDSEALIADIRKILNKVAEFHGAYFAPKNPDLEPD